MTKRFMWTALLIVVAVVASAFTIADARNDERYVTAYFDRAVQIFPGNSVRVLGVDIGRVTEVEVADDQSQVAVTFKIEDEDVKLPDDVEATLIPVSLLGERYVQLFPAYEGGPTFDGDEIAMDRTSVPVEQDELLRSLQDYFGELDPERVAKFVSNASDILRGNGEELNRLIESGSSVIETLANKRDTLSELIVNFNDVTQTLKDRQSEIATLIDTYNVVLKTLNDNRGALEGTITGLTDASAQLAGLLVEHRNPLGADVKTLTRTVRTIDRNVERLGRTGHWANRLFEAASKAVDYDRDWLRLNNQGEPLVELLEFRLRDRLVGVCLRLEVNECSKPAFWAGELPDLFCLTQSCPKGNKTKSPGDRLNDAIKKLPPNVGDELEKELGGGDASGDDQKKKNCRKAKHPKKCRLRQELDPGQTLDELLDELGKELDEIQSPLDGVLDGGLLP
ncbi:MAG: MCE family protein [Actinomycetota bacterium]|nr:MCE family protein [Actinomycetota bacterium]